MTQSSSFTAVVSGFRSARRISALVCVFWLVAGFSSAAHAQLPRLAVSLPNATSTRGCGEKGSVLVAPTIQFELGDQKPVDKQVTDQVQNLDSVSSSGELWLEIALSDRSTGTELSEASLGQSVDAFLGQLPLKSPHLRGIILQIETPDAVSTRLSFGILRLTVTAKAINPALKLAYVFRPGFLRQNAELSARLAAYADLLGVSDSKLGQEDADWVSTSALNKPLLLQLAPGASPIDAMLDATSKTVEMLWIHPQSAQDLERTCSVNRFLAEHISSGMVSAASVPPFVLKSKEKEAKAHWFTGDKGEVVVIANTGAQVEERGTLELSGANPEQYQVAWYDIGTARQAGELPAATGPDGMRTWSGSSERVLIHIRRSGEQEKVLYSAVEVKGGVELTVEEIVARWQQCREAQRRNLQNYRASELMALHFENAGLGTGLDVSLVFQEFFKAPALHEVAQTGLYINGVKFDNKHEFPLPQIEPQKAASQPLELKLDERYRYRLLGTEQVNGVLCYVISVEPAISRENLYSGKIWIDGTTFREVRQTLSLRGQGSNIVVNLETQNYTLYTDAKGQQFNLLNSVSAQQILNAAGRDFVLQRTIRYSDYVINGDGQSFDAALEGEHHSQDPMYADTERGLVTEKIKNGERVLVENNNKRIRSIVTGLAYEGTFNYPVPFAGFSLVDFDWRHTGEQLSLFFAGPILATDLSRQYGSRFRLGFDLAVSALPGENRVYQGSVENKGKDMWYWEETTGIRGTWQATRHLGITGSCYIAYDYFRATGTTDSDYVSPRNGVTLLPGAELKYSVSGYVLSAQITRGERLNWRNYGYSASPEPTSSGYTLYNSRVQKDYFLPKFMKAGWDLSYAGGNQLDRFSRYFPSFFSAQRMHGIPGGTDSFDAIASADARYGFNVMDLVKLEGMYSYSRARNQAESNAFKKFDGLEANVSTRAPWGMLLQGTVSYALHGNLARYNSRWGVYMLLMKPLGQ